MYGHYERRRRGTVRPGALGRWSLRGLFLASFGFAGGILFLLFFLVPFDRWLAERASQGTVDLTLTALTAGWVVIALAVTAVYSALFLRRRRDRPVALGVLGASVALAGVVFFFLLDTDFLVAAQLTGREESGGERITFGSYPDEEKLKELEAEGYDGVITVMNPEIPFERVLLQREKEDGEEIGISIYSFPMLPWISSNEESLSEIKRLVSDNDKRFYIHCYLGKHRVELVRRELDAAEPASWRPIPDNLERGDLRSYDGREVILGPLPTEEEWLDIILRQGVEEVVTTLDPDVPGDAARIEEERELLQGSGVELTERPLDPESPNPEAVEEIAAYVEDRERGVYVHDFGYDARAEALDSALRQLAPAGGS